MRQKELILIVDQSKLNVAVLTKILGDKYSIESAYDGETGLMMAKLVVPDLIVLDIVLPDIDGYEIIMQLKKMNITKDIPIIFISSLSDDADEERGLLLGAVDYIKKPFSYAVVAARVNTHITISKQRKIIENIASLDGLTQIPNRRVYDEFLDVRWARCVNEKLPITIFYADIDYLKQYNDSYGHAQGDVALKAVANTLAQVLGKKGDYVARVGGEEFAIIMLQKDTTSIKSYIDHIRSSIEHLGIEHSASKAANVLTISAGGVTMVPKPGDLIGQMVNRVESNLNRAKENGRNCVVWDCDV